MLASIAQKPPLSGPRPCLPHHGKLQKPYAKKPLSAPESTDKKRPIVKLTKTTLVSKSCRETKKRRSPELRQANTENPNQRDQSGTANPPPIPGHPASPSPPHLRESGVPRSAPKNSSQNSLRQPRGFKKSRAAGPTAPGSHSRVSGPIFEPTRRSEKPSFFPFW